MTNLDTRSRPISTTVSIRPVLPTAGARGTGEPGGEVPAVSLGTPTSGDGGWGGATSNQGDFATLCRG